MLIFVGLQVMAQHTLEKGIQSLTLTGATLKNSILEIEGNGSIHNNKAVSPSETVLEEIDLSFRVEVSAFDNNGSFRYGLGKQSYLAGTYIEIWGNPTKSKITVNRMDNTSLIPVKEYELPFLIVPGEIYNIKLCKRIRKLIVELSSNQNHFLTDTLIYPSPFFGLAWGTPFVACANGIISISDYELSTPFNLHPRLAAWGDSFIEGSSLDSDTLRYISLIKDSIGHENIAIMGRGGENTGSMTNRFASELNWFEGSTYALLAIGVNDMDFNTWKTNVTDYANLVKKRGIIPVLVTLTPRSDRNSFISQANNWIRTAYNGAYVDFSKVVSTDNINWIAGTCMKDQIHPTAGSHQNFFYRITEEAPYLFRDFKVFSIDYENERSIEKVMKTIQYSPLSNFSTVEAGFDTSITLTPGKDLYFRSTAPDKIKFIYDILLVPQRPAAPMSSGVFTAGIFNWEKTPGFDNVSDYEYSTDDGNSWVTCSEKPIKNNTFEAMDVRVKAGSKNFRSLPLHIGLLTSIAQQQPNTFSIYPNPVKNMLTIDHVKESCQVSLYTSEGRLVEVVKLINGTNTISMESLPQGIYMLVIHTESGKSSSLKVLKEN